MARPLGALCLSALVFALAGCITVPDDIKASMAQPDGKRPNNFGKAVPVAAWSGDDGRMADPEVQAIDVVPDRPTIARGSAAPVASGGAK